jgi:hypothetical protein
VVIYFLLNHNIMALYKRKEGHVQLRSSGLDICTYVCMWSASRLGRLTYREREELLLSMRLVGTPSQSPFSSDKTIIKKF